MPTLTPAMRPRRKVSFTEPSSRGERAYTRQVGRVIVVVTGNAMDEELRLLAASLR